jgi:hypothetical protein
MLKPALTHPLQDWALSRLRFVEKRLEHEPTLFRLRLQVSRRAQVSLISQYNEKFRLLTITGVLDHPRRDLACLRRPDSARGRGYRWLPRRGNSSQNSDQSCEKKQ